MKWNRIIALVLSALAGLTNAVLIIAIFAVLQDTDTTDEGIPWAFATIALLFLMLVANFHSLYCYYVYPEKKVMSRGTKQFFVVMRISASIHLLIILVIFFFSIRAYILESRRENPTDDGSLIFMAIYTAIHIYLIIRQYSFLAYIRIYEKKQLKQLIDEIGT